MATTNFNISLDPTLLTQYTNLYFVAFDQNGNPVNFNNGSNYLQLTTTSAVATITQGINTPGAVPSNYLIVASNQNTVTSYFDTIGEVTDQTNANGNYTFGMVEGVLLGNGSGLADITGVNNLGLNLALNIPNNGSALTSSGFKTNLATIFNALPSGSIQGSGTPYALALAPNGNTAQYPSSNWTNYVNGVLNTTTTPTSHSIINEVMFSYNFGGQNGLDLYRASNVGGVFTLTPLFNLPSVNPHIINTDNGNSLTSAYVQQIIYGSVQANTPDAYAVQYLLAGFDAGLWGAQGTYANPLNTNTQINPDASHQTPATVNLSQAWNWNQMYNYNAAVTQTAPDSAHLSNIQVSNILGSNAAYDLYAATLLAQGNPYGYLWSDLLSAGGVSPQLSMAGQGAQAGQDVPNINISVFANGTTPSSSSVPLGGYVQPTSGYLPPTASTYAPANDFLNSQTPANTLLFDLNQAGGLSSSNINYNYHPNENYPITLRIYDPSAAQAGVDGFVNVALATTSSSSSPWSQFNLNSDFTLSTIAPSGQNGVVQINNLPTAEGIGWYQLVIGQLGSPSQTVYDIYENTGNNGQITNITTNTTSEVITLGGIPGGFKIVTSPGASFTYNPLSLMSYNDLWVGTQYQMVLDQALDYGSLAYWSGALANNTYSQEWVAQFFVSVLQQANPQMSATDFVTQLYQAGFGRTASNGEVTYWSDQITSGQLTWAQVDQYFASSAEMWSAYDTKAIYAVGNSVSNVVPTTYWS